MAVSSPFPNRPFSLQVDAGLVSQDIPGNRSYFTAWASIHKDNNNTPTWSNNPRSSWEVTRSGAGVASLAAASGLTFDFRNGTDFPLWSGYFWVPHNADGTFPASAFNAYANYDILGYTSASIGLAAPRIPRGPRVVYGGQWRNTVAYVVYGGQQRIAIPYVVQGGQWRIGGG